MPELDVIRRIWGLLTLALQVPGRLTQAIIGTIRSLWLRIRPRISHVVPQRITTVEVPDDLILTEIVHVHAVELFDQYEETHELGTLREALQSARFSAQLIPPLRCYPRRSHILRTYHSILLEHCRATLSPVAFIDALTTINDCLEFLPENDEYATEAVNFMIKIYNSVLPSMRQEELDSNDPRERNLRRSRILHLLSAFYQSHFDNGQNFNDLWNVCEYQRLAVEAAPSDAKELPFWLFERACNLQTAYGLVPNLDLVNESIDSCRLCLDAARNENADRRAAILETYANGLQMRAKRNANMDDLSLAISLSYEAVAMTTDAKSKIEFLNNLGNRLEGRSDCMRRSEDLREAIRVSKSALEYEPEGFMLGCTKHNIAVKLLKLSARNFPRYSPRPLLDEALSLLGEALHSVTTPDDVPGIWLTSLGAAYRFRYSVYKHEDDLNNAINYQAQAVERIPQQSLDWPGSAAKMASMLRERAMHTRDRGALDAGLSFVLDAANSVPENHVHRSRIVAELAHMYRLAHTFSFGGLFEMHLDGVRWEPPWEDKAIELFLSALNNPLGDSMSRMFAATQLMGIYRDRSEYSRGVEFGTQALDILHKCTTRLLAPDDQQQIVAEFSGIAVETCAMSIQAGKSPDEALELLELGRGVILGLLIEDRSDVSELRAAYPQQADRFERLQIEIGQPIHSEDATLRESLVACRDRQVQELDDLLREIRSLPGQENFFRGPTAGELRSLASNGHIVVVNVADQTSDAIIVSSACVQILHLPSLNRRGVKDWIEKEPTSWTRKTMGEKNNLCRDFLKWLWDECVEPILTTLNLIRDPPSTDLPRLWWIGTGLAASLPFHAAGNHLHGSKANAYSHIISSYTPTIKALGYSRGRASALQQRTVDRPELLVALMPTTPNVDGQPVKPLDNVTEELSAIKNAVSDTHVVQTLVHPTRQAVIDDQLPRCDMAHFACHGYSDTTDPSNSYLALQRPGDAPTFSPVVDKLTVRDVLHKSLRRARIAYLSACSTAENKADQFVDEVIHLASGFQVAGFPHVIAALWPANDLVSVAVAQSFYQRTSAAYPANDRAVALALHEAVTAVRNRYPRQPLLWAQYIHIGV